MDYPEKRSTLRIEIVRNQKKHKEERPTEGKRRTVGTIISSRGNPSQNAGEGY